MLEKETQEVEAMRIKHTQYTYGESDPYQALANAIIVSAVRDFRNATRMIRRIGRSMNGSTDLNNTDTLWLKLRISHYELMQESITRFLLSEQFAILSDLDGETLLFRLKKEAR